VSDTKDIAMADQSPAAAPLAPSAAQGEPPNAQMIVALRIVYVMGLIGVALIAAGVISLLSGKPENAIWLGIGGIVGSLGTALNAPSGVTNALTATKGGGQ
jgi:hypothetical protein